MPPRPHPPQSQKLLPVTVIGSYPPPTWFRHLLEARQAERIGAEEIEEAGRDAMQVVIREQEAAGVDLLTDGELGRILSTPEPIHALNESVGFLWGLLARMEGIEYQRGGEGSGRFRAVGPIRAPSGLGLAAEFTQARAMTDHPLKTTLPGPFSLALMLCDAREADAMQAVLEALGPILRTELETLAAAGARDVQLDEPSLGMFMGINPERWVAYFNELVRGLPFRLHLHICFRNLAAATRSVPRSYKPLMPYLNDLRVEVIHLEYSLNDMRELELLGMIGYDKHVAIGVVDAHRPEVETAQSVATRIRSCLRYVDVRRLRLAPDCGLSALPRAVARAKLKSLAEGAQIVRNEFSRGKR